MIITYLEHSNGLFKKFTFECASYGSALSESLNLTHCGVIIGEVSMDEMQKLSKYGVSKCYIISNQRLNTFIDSAYSSAIASLANSKAGNIVILPQTYNSRSIAPRLAVKMKAAMFPGIGTLLERKDAGYQAKRIAFSNKAIELITTKQSKCVVSLRANAFGLKEKIVEKVETEVFDYVPNEQDFALKPIETKKASDKILLTEADTVVSGGRGLKDPKNWAMVEELAGLLNAATACSKPVADIEWRPHHEHVGQTGLQVSPNVYIAIGISGAIQHLAGISSSKTIIAINNDSDAPIFKAADYGVLGDAFVIVPQLIELIKAYKNTHNS